jgi:Ion channel
MSGFVNQFGWIVGALSVASSLFYIHLNSFYTAKTPRVAWSIWLQSATVVLLGLVVGFQLQSPSGLMIATEVAAILPFLIVVHATRFVLDRRELAERGKKQGSVTKPIGDFLSNVIGITYIVGVVYLNKTGITPFVAILCAALFIYKELIFRLYDDFFLRRPDISGSSLKRNPKEKIPPGLAMAQAVFNRFLKSFCYLFIGYGLVYMTINETSLFGQHGVAFATNTKRQSSLLLVDYSYFSLFQIFGGGYGDFAPVSALAKIVAMTETVLGLIFVGLVLTKAAEAFPSRK